MFSELGVRARPSTWFQILSRRYTKNIWITAFFVLPAFLLPGQPKTTCAGYGYEKVHFHLQVHSPSVRYHDMLNSTRDIPCGKLVAQQTLPGLCPLLLQLNAMADIIGTRWGHRGTSRLHLYLRLFGHLPCHLPEQGIPAPTYFQRLHSYLMGCLGCSFRSGLHLHFGWGSILSNSYWTGVDSWM